MAERAIFQQGHAHIEWLSQNRAEFSGTVMRSEHSGSWQEVGAAWSDGAGLVVFNDASVKFGTRYAYRFDYVVNGVTQQSATIDLTVPAAALSLAISSGNPTHGRLRFSCTLPGAEPATLDLFDIAGRRVESQPLKRAPSGDVTAVLNAAARLDAGVYWARLRQGPCVAGTRVVLLP